MTRPWPWEDTPLKLRERVALSYRALLERADPEACAKLDAEMLEYGQRWLVPQIIPYQDNDLLTADLVADYRGVALKTVYVWRQRGLPSRKTPDGIRFRFADVRDWRSSNGSA